MGFIVLCKDEPITGTVRLTNPTSRVMSYSMKIQLYECRSSSVIYFTDYSTAQDCPVNSSINVPFAFTPSVTSVSYCKTLITVKANGTTLPIYTDVLQPVLITPFIRGDVNGDGILNILDRDIIGRMTLGLSPSSIIVGNPAIVRSSNTVAANGTVLDLTNPALVKGVLNTVSFMPSGNQTWTGTGIKVGLFSRNFNVNDFHSYTCKYSVGFSSFTPSIGVAKTVSVPSWGVEVGDVIGLFGGANATGSGLLSMDPSSLKLGTRLWKSGDYVIPGLTTIFTSASYGLCSLCCTGTTSFGYPTDMIERADVNNDNNINAQDAVAIQLLPGYVV